MNRTKVLHTENAMDYTGGFRALLDYIVYSQSEIESIVILPKGSKCITYLKKHNVKVYEVPFVEIKKNVWVLFKYLPCLLFNAWTTSKIARREKVDILHSNDLYNLTFYIVKYLYRYDRPLFTHLRLMPSSYPGLLYKLYRIIHLKFSDRLIAVSFAVKKAYFNLDKVVVIYDVTDQTETYKSYEVSFDGKRTYRFLYLANYTRGKGQELALEAFERLYSINPNCSLTFAGGTLGISKNKAFKEELIASCKRKKLDQHVIFEDFVENVESKMKAYDCILNFSRSESFSYTSFDALKFGVPLIVSDCGGPAELFENGHSGLLVANGSINDMFLAMKAISVDVEMNKRLSKNSRIRVRDLMISRNRFSYLSELFISSIKTAYGTDQP